MSGATAVVLVAMEWAILVKWSAMTRIVSFSDGDEGRPMVSAMEIDVRGHMGIGGGTRKLWGLWRDALARVQASHVET
jgi:hypothetical protein